MNVGLVSRSAHARPVDVTEPWKTKQFFEKKIIWPLFLFEVRFIASLCLSSVSHFRHAIPLILLLFYDYLRITEKE